MTSAQECEVAVAGHERQVAFVPKKPLIGKQRATLGAVPVDTYECHMLRLRVSASQTGDAMDIGWKCNRRATHWHAHRGRAPFLLRKFGSKQRDFSLVSLEQLETIFVL